MKTYDLVLKLLKAQPELRSSDRKLLWRVWQHQGVAGDVITRESFLDKAMSAEGITRARRKAQELHPELQANQEVKAAREKKAKRKGMWVFNEETQTYYKSETDESYIL
jgi:hypothetical protein